MTIYTQFELRCDGLPGPFDCEPAIYENRRDQAEDTAQRQGWIKKGGKHFCPDHQDVSEDGRSGTAPNPSGVLDAG